MYDIDSNECIFCSGSLSEEDIVNGDLVCDDCVGTTFTLRLQG